VNLIRKANNLLKGHIISS